MHRRRTFRRFAACRAAMLLIAFIAVVSPAGAQSRAGNNITIGPRERDGVVEALRRSSTFRDLFTAARSLTTLEIAIEARPIRARAHFAHERPAPVETFSGFRIRGIARVNVPASKGEFAARLGHELSHAVSLVLEGCLDAPDCRPDSHEARAREAEGRILGEWGDPAHAVTLVAANAILEGPARGAVLTASATPPSDGLQPVRDSLRRLPARPGPFAALRWMPLR